MARTLITEEDYARAEALTGGRGSGAIAAEMGLPRWVVSAWRAELRRVRLASLNHAERGYLRERLEE
ncbi:hypothetical protein [Actinomyces faecalis]|uniref:hypothetical protein n=1 Tax=Actinomyces faecalis TaxID=2722820 RepID=UPI001558074E|nr:hypothetical protein [Actinomyces faecalis]